MEIVGRFRHTRVGTNSPDLPITNSQGNGNQRVPPCLVGGVRSRKNTPSDALVSGHHSGQQITSVSAISQKCKQVPLGGLDWLK